MNVSAKEYICPGETHPISRSVHLARMAAFYPKCGNCPCRTEIGQFAPEFAEKRTAGGHVPRRSLVTPDGLRGIFLNELGRSDVFSLTAAFAALLWECIAVPRDFGKSLGTERHPTVVVGYDQRPSSPQLVAGVLDGLRQMGCGVIDAGPATTPYLWWNVARTESTGGILITGAGCDPSWSGIDFIGPDCVPVSAAGSQAASSQGSPKIPRNLTLEQIETRSRLPRHRPTRSAGEFRTVRDWAAYEASVAVHFHALRPLRVVVGTGTTLLQRMLESLFRRLPCELVAVPLPTRARRLDRPDDADVIRAANAIRETSSDVAVLIDDDGQTCAVLDETGRLVSSADVTQRLARQVLEDDVEAIIVSETDVPNSTRAGMFEAMQTTGASFGGGIAGRFWCRDEGPVCDAFRTLAAILSALSRSDAVCSAVFAIRDAGS